MISLFCKTYCHLEIIHNIKHLSQDTFINGVPVVIISDYCNALQYAMDDYNSNHLQQNQNGVAWMVTENRKCSHVEIILQKLQYCKWKGMFETTEPKKWDHFLQALEHLSPGPH